MSYLDEQFGIQLINIYIYLLNSKVNILKVSKVKPRKLSS